MNVEWIREQTLLLDAVEEGFPFGEDTLVFKVNNKIFLLVALDEHPLRFNVKCNPERAIELREEYPETVLPGYHMNKKHWNTIVVNGNLNAKQLMEMVKHSYELVKGGNKK